MEREHGAEMEARQVAEAQNPLLTILDARFEVSGPSPYKQGVPREKGVLMGAEEALTRLLDANVYANSAYVYGTTFELNDRNGHELRIVSPSEMANKRMFRAFKALSTTFHLREVFAPGSDDAETRENAVRAAHENTRDQRTAQKFLVSVLRGLAERGLELPTQWNNVIASPAPYHTLHLRAAQDAFKGTHPSVASNRSGQIGNLVRAHLEVKRLADEALRLLDEPISAAGARAVLHKVSEIVARERSASDVRAPLKSADAAELAEAFDRSLDPLCAIKQCQATGREMVSPDGRDCTWLLPNVDDGAAFKLRNRTSQPVYQLDTQELFRTLLAQGVCEQEDLEKEIVARQERFATVAEAAQSGLDLAFGAPDQDKGLSL